MSSTFSGRRLVSVAVLAWTALLLTVLPRQWQEWARLLSDAVIKPPALPNWPQVLGATGRHGLTCGILATLIGTCLLGGGRPLAFLGRTALSRLSTICVRIALGWGVAAAVLLGLACAGLYTRMIIPLSLVVVALAGGLMYPLKLPGLPAHRGGFIKWSATCVLFGASGGLLLVANALPDVFYDTYSNHLAAPEHFLKAHRYTTIDQHYSFNYPSFSELLNGLALLVHRDELAHWISLIPCFAACGVAASWLGGGSAAGIGIGMSLGLGGFGWVVLRGKNDPAVIGFLLLALVFHVRSRRTLSLAFWALALNVKLNALMLMVPVSLWTALEVARGTSGRGRLPSIGQMVCLMLVSAPPFLRTWLDRGNPLWPALAGWMHGLPWEPDLPVAFSQYHMGPGSALGGAARFLPDLISANRILIWAAPMVWLHRSALPASSRRAASLGIWSFLFMAVFIHLEYGRYSLPVLFLGCFVCAPVIMEWIRSGRSFAVRVCFMSCAALIGASSGAAVVWEANLSPRQVIDYLTGAVPYESWIRTSLSTRQIAQERMNAEPARRKLMLLSEVYSFKWPGRVVTDTIPGRSLSWALTRYCRTPERVAVKIRQLNVSHMVFNYVSEGHPYNSNVYTWDRRQMELWHDYLVAFSHPLDGRLPNDIPNGGFCLYALSSRPTRSRGPLFYLPGNKPVRYFVREPYATRGDMLSSVFRAEEMSKVFPDVLIFKHEAGIFYAGMGDWKKGYRLLKECIDLGMPGEAGHIYLGKCAMRLGKVDEGVAYLNRARVVHPDQRDAIDRALADSYVSLVRESMRRGKRDQALEYALEARRILPNSQAAMVALGDIYRGKGEFQQALVQYEAALKTDNLKPALRQHISNCINLCREMLLAPRKRESP